jgi:dipeptidase D
VGQEDPGWQPDLDSPALAACRRVYERVFGEAPIVTAVHAWLETAVIGDRVPGGLDMVSFGPQIERRTRPTSGSASRPSSDSGDCSGVVDEFSAA